MLKDHHIMDAPLSCSQCGGEHARYACGHGCQQAVYCGQECAQAHYENGHSDACIAIDAPVVGTVSAFSTAYRTMPFYAASKAMLRRLRETDIFSWLCVQSFMTTPLINDIIFGNMQAATAGDWTQFDERFGDVYKKKARVAAMVDKQNPYTIFETFFATLLVDAAKAKRPLTAPRNRRAIITTQQALETHYPQMARYFDMRNSDFTRAYAWAIQKAAMQIPRQPRDSVSAFRGYTPLNIPNTWSLDVDRLRVGQTITNWSFMSISLDRRISAGYIDPKAACCMMIVHIPAGSSVPLFLLSSDASDTRYHPQSIVAWPPQQEVLLPAGTTLRVVKKPGKKRYMASDGATKVTTRVVEVVAVRVERIKIRA